MIHTRITHAPLDPQEVLGEVGSESDGAVLLFLGVVRDHHDGRAVTGLEYEAYRSMAERVLAAIGHEAGEAFGLERASIAHRVGSLQVGEVSMAIAVASPHRAEAYEASRYIIENVKARLPVWKKEHYTDGSATWVDGRTPTGAGTGTPEGRG